MIIKQNVKLFTLLLFLCHGYVFAQNDVITGKVTGPENEELPGVNIQISGTNSGAITDFDGNYSLEAGSDASLVFSYIGFVSQTVQVNGRSIRRKPSFPIPYSTARTVRFTTGKTGRKRRSNG